MDIFSCRKQAWLNELLVLTNGGFIQGKYKSDFKFLSQNGNLVIIFEICFISSKSLVNYVFIDTCRYFLLLEFLNEN